MLTREEWVNGRRPAVSIHTRPPGSRARAVAASCRAPQIVINKLLDGCRAAAAGAAGAVATEARRECTLARTRRPSHRTLLLASAAGFAGLAAFGNTGARAGAFPSDLTVSTQLSSPTTLETLPGGGSLTVTSTGGLTITSAATGSQPAVAVTGAGAGVIVNSGTIVSDQPNFGIGIHVNGGASLGSVTNDVGGVIEATGTNGAAIENNGSIVGGVANSGVIESGGRFVGAVYNYGYIGSVTNNAGGVIQASAQFGTAVYNYGYIGSLTNSLGGVIQATGADGVAIQNYGTLSISNSGLIQATGTSGSAIVSQSYQYEGTITNNVGGVIQATGGGGTAINNSGTLAGIANSGLIQATGTGGVAVFNRANYYDWIGTITNTAGGVIQATGSSGVAIDNTGTLVSLVNAGTIQSLLGTAIVDAGSIPAGITNAAGGLIRGGAADGSGIAIDASGANQALSIINAGTIIGAIKQSALGDTLTVTGGAIIGEVIGQPGSHGVANFALGSGSFTTGGNITGVDTVNLISGELVMAPGGGSIAGAQAFNILQGGHAVLGGTLGAVLTTNSGILDTGTNAATLNGNYVQTASGILEIGVSGSTVGKLTIAGGATITPGPESVLLHFTGPANLSASSTLMEVQSGLTLTSGTTLTVTSDSPNPYYQSPIVTDPVNVLTLTFAPPTQSALLSYVSSLFPAGNSAYLASAASAYSARIVSLNESTFNTITGIISTATPAQSIAIEQQAAPRSIATAAAQLADGLGANTGLDIAIAARQMAAHGAEGDPPGPGIVAWAQPFGSTAYQSSVQNFGGFSALTYGAAFGGDARVAPDIRVGGAFALANSNINYTGGSDGNTDTMTSAQFGVYGTYYRHNLFVDAELSGGYNWFTSKQTMAFLGQQNGSYGGSQFAARAGIGYNLPLPGAVLTPGASIRELHMGFDGYTMSGGLGPSAHINAETLDLVQSRVGAQITYLPAPLQGWILRPELHAYYLHNFNSSGVTTSGSFSSGLPFSVSAPSRDANLMDLGFGLTISRHGPFSFGASVQWVAGHSTSNDIFLLHLATEF